MSTTPNPYKRRKKNNKKKYSSSTVNSNLRECYGALNRNDSGEVLSPIQKEILVCNYGGIRASNKKISTLYSEPHNSKNERIALIFDTETTGKIDSNKPASHYSQPDLIQLGIILVKTSKWDKPLMKLSVLVSHERDLKMDPGAQTVHGISLDECKRFGIPLKTALYLFKKAVENADFLVAHNLRFDLFVIETALHRVECDEGLNLFQTGNVLYQRQHVCTMKLCTDILQLPSTTESGKYKWPSLSQAYFHFFKKPLINNHDALADATACSDIFHHLFQSGYLSLENDEFSSSHVSLDSKMISPLLSQSLRSERYYTSSTSSYLSPSKNYPVTPLNNEERHNKTPVRLFSNEQSLSHPKHLPIHEVTPSKNEEVRISKTKGGFLVSRQNHSVLRDDRGCYSPRIKRPKRGDLYIHSAEHLSNDLIYVKGKTYEYKDELKSLGGSWSPEERSWYFDRSQETVVFKYVYGFRV